MAPAPAERYRCPRCGGSVDGDVGSLDCEGCGARYPVAGGVPDFVDDAALEDTSRFYERVFDRAAAIYESPLWYPLGIRLGGGTSVDRVVDWVVDRVPPGAVVIDAPTGTGLYAVPAAERAARVDGVDLAGGMLRRARRNARRAGAARYRVARARVEALPFADGAFDVGICAGALYLLPDPVEALTELGRVLDDDARLLGMTVVAGGPLAAPPLRRGYEAATGIDVADVGSVEGWLDEAGYGLHDTDRWGAILLFDARR